jgi:hypothetical protein
LQIILLTYTPIICLNTTVNSDKRYGGNMFTTITSLFNAIIGYILALKIHFVIQYDHSIWDIVFGIAIIVLFLKSKKQHNIALEKDRCYCHAPFTMSQKHTIFISQLSFIILCIIAYITYQETYSLTLKYFGIALFGTVIHMVIHIPLMGESEKVLISKQIMFTQLLGIIYMTNWIVGISAIPFMLFFMFIFTYSKNKK